jgi:hypothetical protein
MFHITHKAIHSTVLERICSAKQPKEVYEALTELPGIARFLGYQIFVDLTYIPEFPFSENFFVVSGPGCGAGLERLFDDPAGLNEEELLVWLREHGEEVLQSQGVNIKELFSDRPLNERRLNLMSIENQMCELGKTVKILRGEGKARGSYAGRPEAKKNTIF